MERFDITPEHAERLLVVQRRARELAIKHPQVRAWFRQAFDIIVASHRDLWATRRSTEERLQDVLGACASANASKLPRRLSGFSFRFQESSSELGFPEAIEVILPKWVVALIESVGTSSDQIRDTKLVAAQVLASRRAMFEPESPVWKDLIAQAAAGTAVRTALLIHMAIEPELPDPTHLEDYNRLTPELQYNVGLFLLSGFVDLGAMHTVIPKPECIDEGDESAVDCWYARFPIIDKYEHLTLSSRSMQPGAVSPAVKPDPYAVDPDLTEQWLAALEIRVALELSAGEASPIPPEPETANDDAPEQHLEKSWEVVQGSLLRMKEQGLQYESLTELASKLNSTPWVVRSAVNRSPSLKEWQRASKQNVVRPTTGLLSGVLLDRATQTSEPSPLDAACQQEEIENLMQRLVEEASPEHRAQLHRLSPEERRRVFLRYKEDPESWERRRWSS